MRDRRFFIRVTALQFIASIALLVYVFGAGMARFRFSPRFVR